MSAGIKKAFTTPKARPAGNLAPAFQIIRQLLAEKPRTFQQILQDGVAMTGTAEAGPSTPVAPPTPVKSKKGKVVKGKKAEVAVNAVPAGHPFVSASFLKSRVLPVLASQDLIIKSSKATPVTPAGTFAWSLAPSTPSETSTWDTEAHWDRLLSPGYGESPGSVALAYKTHQAEVKRLKRLAAQDDPANRAARRTEREVWAWEGRAEGLTTELERRHLNVRKARGRPEKERARLGGFGLRGQTDVEAVVR